MNMQSRGTVKNIDPTVSFKNARQKTLNKHQEMGATSSIDGQRRTSNKQWGNATQMLPDKGKIRKMTEK